ncbi:BLUF domain-containing protein [Enterovibrio paralichthyis]|uniref:BLUF domain-containing protein n=1 Tax=Enterovibrio paralichthyis TaxID=2853805 RepID=UPI0006D2C194|nr:BLUF domain-containing protein [Enterovibrio paralichthyis]MBV7300292.1 BLUF domain-containing protein [Enterovibrio paralichthyis]
MIRVIYASSATAEFGESELMKILGKARANNEPSGITGLLLYSKGNFFQVLEGEESDIDQIWPKINADERHTGVIVLDKSEIDERAFSGWSMGFRNLETFDKSVLRGYSDILDNPLSPEQFKSKGSEIVGLIEQFRSL